MEGHGQDAGVGSNGESSPLDDPLNGTYIRVIVVEVLVIAFLFVIGRMFR